MNSQDKSSGVSTLWESHDETEWRVALARYWCFVKPGNRDLEVSMNQLNVEWVKKLDAREWYSFLYCKYFPWKYTAPNRLETTRRQLRKYENGVEELFYIKEHLFVFDLANVEEGLKIAQAVKGLGWAGASGLLAVLFPEWFGTVDQFAVKALANVPTLAEQPELRAMNPKHLTKENAVVLIEIMRRKAGELNELFATDEWTPRKVDMILWAARPQPRPAPLF